MLATRNGKQLKWKCHNDAKYLRWSCGLNYVFVMADFEVVDSFKLVTKPLKKLLCS